jgi:hypothetical protein
MLDRPIPFLTAAMKQVCLESCRFGGILPTFLLPSDRYKMGHPSLSCFLTAAVLKPAILFAAVTQLATYS